jgi:hypothetical protein
MSKPTKIKIHAGVRYWCDCQYSTDKGVTWNNPSDTDEDNLTVRELLPCVEYYEKERGWYWCLNVDFNSGKIENWKQGLCLKTFFKVCDDGKYQIIDNTDNIIWDSDVDSGCSYVPTFLEIDSSNYGDNIYITIDGEGTIKDWDIAKDRICELFM